MKELGEIITGNTPSKKTEEFWNSEDICLVKPDIIADNGINEIVDSNEFISEDARKKARVVGKNAIFITCIGSIGKIGIASDGEYAFNQQINAIIPNDRVQPKYLAYNLLFNKPRLVAMANAPVVPIINKSQFGEFSVNIETDIERQYEIVDVLDKLTQIIQQRNKEISALDDLIKARFVEMFGSIHERTEYPYVAVKDLTDVISGGTPSRDKSEYWEDGTIPWVKTTELKNNIIVNVDEYITEAGLNGSSAKMVPVGTVLVAMYGQGKTRGMTAYLNIEACTNQACACILPSDRIDSMFMWKFFELSYEKLRSLAQGAGQTNLNGNMIKNFQVLVPPIELQKEYVDFVHQTDKSKVAIQAALDKSQLLFDSLMQKYFG